MLLIIVFLFNFYRPIHVVREFKGVIFFNDQLENTDITLDVTIRRKLLSLSKVDGIINVIDRSYKISNNKVFSDNETFPLYNGKSVIEILKEKIFGDTFDIYHRTPKELLLVIEITKNFEIIQGSILDHSSMKNFYAPASSVDSPKK